MVFRAASKGAIEGIAAALEYFSRKTRRGFGTQNAESHHSFERIEQLGQVAVERDERIMLDEQAVAG